MEEFLEWVLLEEVQNTKHFGELFREDNFRVNCIRSVLYGDEGIKFLKQLLKPTIKEVLSNTKTLKINPIDPEDEKECLKNVKTLLKLAESFVNHFGKIADSFPPTLRKTFYLMHQIVTKKFPTDKPFIVDLLFFYFICPAIINPLKFKLIRGRESTIPENAAVGLVSFSKILNDLALFSHEKQRYSEVSAFIKSKHSFVMGKVMQMIDLNKGNLKTTVYTDEDKEIATDILFSLLQGLQIARLSAEIQTIPLESPEMFKIMRERWMEKLNAPGWKKILEIEGITVSMLKEKNTNVIAVKSVCIFKTTGEKALDTLYSSAGSKELDDLIYKFETLRAETIEGQGKFRQVYYEDKLAFPFTNRDLYLNEWVCISPSEPERFSYISDELVKPRTPGIVRAKLYLSGSEIVPAPGNPSHCLFSTVTHGDAGGSLPAWVMNLFAKNAYKRLIILRKMAERK